MNFRTASHVAIPVATVSLLLLAVGVSGAWYVQRLQRQASALLDQNVASIRAAEELEVYLLRIRFELSQFLIAGRPDDLSQAIAMQGDVENWLSRANELPESDEEKKALREIDEGLSHLFAELNDSTAMTDAASAQQHVRQLVDQVLSEEILPQASAFLDFNEEELEASSRENQRLAGRLVLALLLLGTCGAIAGLVAGYGMARGISRSILQLSFPVRDVAGQLSQVVGPVTLPSDPGLEDLEQVLNAVSIEVETVIRQLHERQHEVLRTEQLAAIGQLASGLAHELRNPLMCMTVLVQSAISKQEQTLNEHDLHVLDDELTRLDKLLQKFLDFARSGNMTTTDVDVRDAVERTVELLAAKAKQLNLKICVSLPAHPVMVRADVNQLRQLILNLLLNSIDATTTSGQISVKLINEPLPSERCRLYIEDTGPGFRHEEVDRFFEPFYSTKEGGLGMGLAVCQRIVDAHQGEITATNTPHGGAVITVRLPTIAANCASDAWVATPAAGATTIKPMRDL